jgi:predicted metal-dependent phosphotriesterase family hydrolase
VLSEVVRVMEICAEANIIFATGYSSPEESITLARKAREVGVRKCVVTHANSGIWKMTHDQIKRCIDLGAWMEYSYITNLWGPGTGLPDFERMSDKEFADFARIAPQRSIITTDLGQVGMPHPVDGMRRCILALLENGLAQKQVDFMVRSNPAQLVGLSVSE